MNEYSANPNDVKKLFLVVGGDHGQGAFRFIIRCLVSLRGKTLPVHSTKCIAEVYCKKDEDTLLDATCMSWLNEDLQKISTSKLRLRSAQNDRI